MDDRQLWQQLRQHEMTSQSEYPETQAIDKSETLWYVRLLQGVGGWFAALLLLAFIGFMVAPVFQYPAVAALLGLVMNFAAFHYYRQMAANRSHEFLNQLFLVLSLAGQSLFSFALGKLLGWHNDAVFLLLFGYQFVLVLIMHDFVHRLLSTLFAVILLFWGHSILLISGLGSAAICLILVWVWMHKVDYHAKSDVFEPIAYALALAVVGLNIQAVNGLFNLGHWHQNDFSYQWLLDYGLWISAFLHFLAFAYLFYGLNQNQQLKDLKQSPILAFGLLLVIVLLSIFVYGFSSAVLLLFIGFARRNRPLMAWGVIAMLGFASWYYYQLEVTLLNKSMTLLGLGFFMLLVVMLTRKGSKQIISSQHLNRHSGIVLSAVLLTLLATLSLVNYGIYQKQGLLQEGRLVLLPLAPVDPRSLMQGDYMRLRFALSGVIQQAMAVNNSANNSELNQAVIRLNSDKVAEFVRLYSGQDVTDDALVFNFMKTRRGIKLTTDAYFFEEGSASVYEGAEYGGFRVNDKGESLLIGLYGADFQLLSADAETAEN